MSDGKNNIATWISIAIILFGMATAAIAFAVTTNNKANTNETVNCNQDEKINTLQQEALSVKTVTKSIDELRKDYKKSNENQTEILVAIGRLETKIEGLENR